MKKLKFIFISLFFLLIFSKNALADSINNILMDIYIDKNGNAHVTELWDVNVSSNTEVYKPYGNIGNSKFLNFTVSLNNEKFTYVPSWDVSGTFTEKQYKNGINYTKDGLELCWGITKYGHNIYTLTYDITNFITKLDDADMLYWTLIPSNLSNKPQNINIKIYGDESFEDNLEVWGYGNYGGTAYVYDGVIEMNSEGTLDSDEYMTILVKFPKDYFNTNNIIDKDFQYYFDMAEDGAKHYNKILNSIINFILSNIITIFIIFTIIYGIVKANQGILVKNKNEKKIPKDVNYFRDIPCQNDIFMSYFIATEYKLIKNNTDLFGAIILNWYKNKVISIIPKGQSYTVNDKVKTAKSNVIVLKNINEVENILNNKEKELYNWIIAASKDNYLEENEFSNWCKKNYNKINKWFKEIIEEEKNKLVDKGYIEKTTSGKVIKNIKYVAKTNLFEEAKKLAGLKRFLKDFSNIKDRQLIEVNLWEYYLIYAQIFGIAKEVAKDLKRLYPEVISDEVYNDYVFVTTFSAINMRTYRSSYDRAHSYNSGGGGFSSGGGGGGSFGGSSGGGFR